MIKRLLLLVLSLFGVTLLGNVEQVKGELEWPVEWVVFPLDSTMDNAKLKNEELKNIPTKLILSGQTIIGHRVKVKGNRLDLAPLFGGVQVRNTAYVFLSLHSKTVQKVTLGIGADWWFQAWLNGKELINTLESGNLDWPPHITNYTMNVKLNRGENILAVKFISGNGSSILTIGGPEQLRKIPEKSWRSMRTVKNILVNTPKIQPNYNTDGITDITESVVILPRKATLTENTAAKELISYIEKSTGKKIKLIREGEETQRQNLIYLGHTKYASINGFNFNCLDTEQWFIRTVNGNLILTGGTPRGVLYSIYHFLEKIVGVHWWSPWEEFVPKHKVLPTGKLELSGKPAFKLRCLDTYHLYSSTSGKEKLWAPRNRINCEMFTSIPYEYGGGLSYGPPSFVHTEGAYYRIMRDRKLLKPAWVAMVKGKRKILDSRYSQLHQLCLSNTEMRKAFLKLLKEQIKKTRNQKNPPVIFDISFNDISSRCECKDCAALVKKYGGNDSGLLLDFINQMADGIKDEYPNIMISTLAYMNSENIPEGITPRDNVIITLCDTVGNYTVPHNSETRFIKLLKKWSQISKKVKVWDYHTAFGDYTVPMPLESTIQPDLMLFKKYDIYGVMTEYHFPIFEDMRDLRLWLFAKLYENPFQDQNRLVMTFTNGFYGSAGIYIRKYLELLQNAVLSNPCSIATQDSLESFKYFTPHIILEAQKLFDAAEKDVGDSKIFLRRVRHARLGIDKVAYILFHEIRNNWIKTGKKTDFFPLDRREIAERIKNTVKQQTELRILKVTPLGRERANKIKKRFLQCLEKEILWDSCDNINKLTWNQPAWRPKWFKKEEIGKMSLCTENPQEGKGCIKWTVSFKDLTNKLKQRPSQKLVRMNYLHGRDFSRNKIAKFYIKCNTRKHPPLYVSIGTSHPYLILRRNEVTNDWKEIVWNLKKDARKVCTHTYFRIFTPVKEFKENDMIDVCIDNMRLVR